MQKEDEILRQEEELLQKDEDKYRDEDIEDQEKRLAEQKALYEELERKKQSSVVKQNLPRPLIVNQKYLKNINVNQNDKQKAEAEQLILEEVQAMVI